MGALSAEPAVSAARYKTNGIKHTYEELQQENVELRVELDSSLSFIKKIQSESQAFKNNFDCLQESYEESKEKERTAKAQLIEAVVKLEQMDEMQEQLKGEFYTIIQKKSHELDEVKRQVLSERDVDVLRVRLLEEIEVPHLEREAALKRDIDHYRSAFYQLRRDNELIKQDRDQLRREHDAIVGELSESHALELEEWRRRVSVGASAPDDAKAEFARIRLVVRENKELHYKVKTLLAEVEDVRSRLESTSLALDQATKLSDRQISELKLQSRSMETDRDALATRFSNLTSEFEKLSHSRDNTALRLTETERALVRAKSESEETTHRYTTQLADVRIELKETASRFDSDRDALLSDLQEQRSTVEDLHEQLKEMSDLVASKEKDAERRVQVAREEEQATVRSVDAARIELQSRVDELARSAKDDAEEHRLRLVGLRAENSELMDSKRSLEREHALSDSRIRQQQEKIEELSAAVSHGDELAKELRTLKTKYDDLSYREAGLEKANSEQDLVAEQLRTQIADQQAYIEREQHTFQQTLEQARASAATERRTLSSRLSDLKLDFDTIYSKYKELHGDAKKLKSKASKRIRCLSNEVKLLSARAEKLRLEKECDCSRLSAEIEILKAEANASRRRQDQFREIFDAEISPLVPVPVGRGLNSDCLNLDRATLMDIASIHEQVDSALTVQREQMEAYGGRMGTPLRTPGTTM